MGMFDWVGGNVELSSSFSFLPSCNKALLGRVSRHRGVSQCPEALLDAGLGISCLWASWSKLQVHATVDLYWLFNLLWRRPVALCGSSIL